MRPPQAQGQEEILLSQERAFFEALLQRDFEALDIILAEDFTLTDTNGSQMIKEQFIGVMQEGQLKFLSIAPQSGTRVRLYGTAAAVTGRTMIQMQFMDTEVSVESRHTHVYALDAGIWRLEIAQSTPLQQPSIV